MSSPSVQDAITYVSTLAAQGAKFVASLVIILGLTAVAVASYDELSTERIVVDPVDNQLPEVARTYVPTDLNRRIVENIERIRTETADPYRIGRTVQQKAVTKVDDVSFKAENIDISVVKVLAPIKAMLGRQDRRVSSQITCFRPQCAAEPEDETVPPEPSTTGSVIGGPTTKAPSPPQPADTIRVRFSVVIEGKEGVRTYQTRLSLNTRLFRREIDRETLRIAEAILEQVDPVSAASFFFVRAGQAEQLDPPEGSRIVLHGDSAERYRGRAVESLQRAKRLPRADTCWISTLIATISYEGRDLNGAEAEIKGIGAQDRRDSTCRARIDLVQGQIWLRSGLDDIATSDPVKVREGTDRITDAVRQFRSIMVKGEVDPQVRAAAADAAAEAAVQQPAAAAVAEVEDPVTLLTDAGEVTISAATGKIMPGPKSVVGTDVHLARYLAGKLRTKSAMLVLKKGQVSTDLPQLDDALWRFWKALQDDPGAVTPYAEIVRSLLLRADVNRSRARDDIAEAAVVVHQALNNSKDADDILLTVIASGQAIAASGKEVSASGKWVAEGNQTAALQRLSNIPYLLDRSRYPLPGLAYAQIGYARWLFLLRADASLNGSLCTQSDSYGSSRLSAVAPVVVGTKEVPCSGTLPDPWWRVRKYEAQCSVLWPDPLAVAACLDRVDAAIARGRDDRGLPPSSTAPD
jgi:hypothetical protein